MEPGRPEHLPPGLTTTVGLVGAILGEVVREAEGARLFAAVEEVRREMVVVRDATAAEAKSEALSRAEALLADLSLAERILLARAYTLYLELVNVCENAYRSQRLAQRPSTSEGAKARLTFVLTAHPTEARSPANIHLLRRVQDSLVKSLVRGIPVDHREVAHALHLAWRLGTHPAKKPSVEDEAAHLFSLLTDTILHELIALEEAGHEVRIRTWVGGDKDGHPGVGPDQTVASLTLSRARLLDFVEGALMARVREDVALGADPKVAPALAALERTLRLLRDVDEGDGGRIHALHRRLAALRARYEARHGAPQPELARLAALLRIFPALVVPLELREERGHFTRDDPIAAMLRRLAVIGGDRIEDYARSVVVSMACEAEDLLEAHQLVGEVLREAAIPVVPLFELPEVLERAPEILAAAHADPALRAEAAARGFVEVMLGYSDTAKRMGMLASRVGVHRAMRRIGQWAHGEGIEVIFFHGHGGSVGRGGGRIEDLAATWPPAARSPYKYTLQGEMVERTLATPEILRSLVDKVASVQGDPPAYRGVGPLASELAEASQAVFSETVASEDFLELLRRATPYPRLSALTIGSRPTRRGGDGSLEKLRAIPWVLCWTQTRLLLHAWLGVGEAWRALREQPDIDARLEEARRTDPLFRSYARLLSFTLAKTSPEMWQRYREKLAPDGAATAESLNRDYEAALDLARRAAGGALLADRPWLAESIHYRAPMIHPLNLLQIELLAKTEWTDAEQRLFRETVTGVAAGMLTTG
jgi:phosphoenolpyruvate carboxylase